MNILEIIKKIDEFLEKAGKKSTNPVEANEMLEKAGLLNDSDTRKGKPLRELLRRRLIRHAYQPGGPRSSWVIPHSTNAVDKETLKVKKSSEAKPVVPLQKPITSTFLKIDFNDVESIKKHGFAGFQSIGSLYQNPNSIPKQMGIYFVINLSAKDPKFLEKGTGGKFKKKDKNVPIKMLEENWVENTKVIYIGKAGKPGGGATLQSRLKQYLEYGHGQDIGHEGGRFIWQLEKPDNLLLCWKTLSMTIPRDEETTLIKAFKAIYGKRPFANLVD